MDRDVALMTANTAAKAAHDVGNLAFLLKACGDDEEALRIAIGSATHEIMEPADVVYRRHHELKTAAEARLAAYDRSYY